VGLPSCSPCGTLLLSPPRDTPLVPLKKCKMAERFNIWKILTSLVTAGLVAAFGWIIKVETEMVQLRSDLSEQRRADTAVRSDIDDVEDDIAALEDRQRKGEVDYAGLKSDLKAILTRVNEIKDDLSRIR